MEPLFTTQTAYTLEEFQKYNRKLMLGKAIVLFVLLTILLDFVSIMATKNLFYGIISTVYMIIAIAIFPLLLNSNAKKLYYSNKRLQKDGLITFDFYSDHIEAKSRNSFERVDYPDIARVIESKTNFYIMISMNQGYMIVKSNCSPELIAFITSLKNK